MRYNEVIIEDGGMTRPVNQALGTVVRPAHDNYMSLKV